MSVFELSQEEYRRIYATIRNDISRNGYTSGYARCIVPYAEQTTLKELNSMGSNNDPVELMFNSVIQCWLNRLYWSNQFAYIATYKDADRTINDLSDDVLSGGLPYSPIEMARTLECLQYNCTSNGGTYTVFKDDAEKLEAVILTAYRRHSGRV
jgi:hypothetical protein